MIWCRLVWCGSIRLYQVCFDVLWFDAMPFYVIWFDCCCFGSMWFYLSLIVFIWRCPVWFDIIKGVVWLCNDLIQSVSMCFDQVCVYRIAFGSAWFIVIRCELIQYEGLGWFNFIAWIQVSDAGRFGLIQVFVVLFDVICLDMLWLHLVVFFVKTCYMCVSTICIGFQCFLHSRTERWVSRSSCDSWSFIDMVRCGVRVSYSEDSSQTH